MQIFYRISNFSYLGICDTAKNKLHNEKSLKFGFYQKKMLNFDAVVIPIINACYNECEQINNTKATYHIPKLTAGSKIYAITITK